MERLEKWINFMSTYLSCFQFFYNKVLIFKIKKKSYILIKNSIIFSNLNLNHYFKIFIYNNKNKPYYFKLNIKNSNILKITNVYKYIL